MSIPHAGPITVDDTSYGYFVTKYVCIIFITLFGISTILHIGQSFRYRLRWLLWTAALCGLGEVIGWSGRLWSSINPIAEDPFMMQICCTIIAPTFLVAAMFITLGRVISIVGPEYSRLSPSWYSKIFISADVLALVIQAVGGAMASIADDPEGSKQGANVMLAGIGIQFAAIVLYALFAAEFLFRAIKDKPIRSATGGAQNTMDSGVKQMIAGLSIMTLFLFMRTIYRTIELTDGWNGAIISNQALFNWLDGMPITVAMFTLNIFHPGRLVYNAERQKTLPLHSDSQLPLSSFKSGAAVASAPAPSR